MSDQARVQVEARGILVGCSANATQLALDSKQELRDQISSAVFAHERQCGSCDTTAAYEQGSPGFLKSIEAARSMQDQMDEKRADDERRGD